MKKSLLPVLFAPLFTMLLLSCHKQEVKTESTYTFTNTTGQRVTFDMYGSKDDYNNNRNRIAQYDIGPGSALSIPLEKLRTFWIDWYSAGYSFNNWIDDSLSNDESLFKATPNPEITIADEDDSYSIGSRRRDTSRSVLLDGDGISTTWKVNINTVAALNGVHTFLFRKDFSGQYTFNTASGQSITKPIRYYIYNEEYSGMRANSFRLKVYDGGPSQFSEIYFNSDPYSFPHFGRDTLMVSFSNVNYYEYYSAERQ